MPQPPCYLAQNRAEIFLEFEHPINYGFKAMFLKVIATRILNIVQFNGDVHIFF